MVKCRTTLTKPDIACCIELFTEEVTKLVADGKHMRMLGAFYLCVSGTLDSLDQAFSPGSSENSHALRLHFRADYSLETEQGE